MVELALEMDGVERHAVAGGRDLGIDDIGAGAGAGAGDHGEQARMVGREEGNLGHAAEGVGGDMRDDRTCDCASASRMSLACSAITSRSVLSQ